MIDHGFVITFYDKDERVAEIESNDNIMQALDDSIRMFHISYTRIVIEKKERPDGKEGI